MLKETVNKLQDDTILLPVGNHYHDMGNCKMIQSTEKT